MDETTNIYFVGTAGSGKSTLTNAFQLWMQQQGYDAITVNLDPGAERIPYPADVDVRDWISLSEVMDRYSLGPNGAQVMCADMLGLKAREIKEAIEDFKTDYVLIDTPGQIELFAYRESSRTAVQILGANRSMIAFLYDPVLSKSSLGFTSLLMLGASVQFRFPLPFTNILSKTDMLTEEELNRILTWGKDAVELEEALLKEKSGLEREVNFESLRILENLGAYKTLIPISSNSNWGMEDLYNSAQQVFMGGEDLTH
ncbi:MAG: ATP/GTP-binding protein [Candidatus Hydrothermarchaeales archaeon]